MFDKAHKKGKSRVSTLWKEGQGNAYSNIWSIGGINPSGGWADKNTKGPIEKVLCNCTEENVRLSSVITSPDPASSTVSGMNPASPSPEQICQRNMQFGGRGGTIYQHTFPKGGSATDSTVQPQSIYFIIWQDTNLAKIGSFSAELVS